MGRSFYYGTDAELLAGSRAFAAAISRDPERYGLVARQCVDYAAVARSYADACTVSNAPSLHTAVT